MENLVNGHSELSINIDDEQQPPLPTPHSPLPILSVPACGKGMGGGHITRCMALVSGLRALGREAWLFFSENSTVDSLVESANFNRAWLAAENDLQEKKWGCIDRKSVV
jgi:hypothetical protein